MDDKAFLKKVPAILLAVFAYFLLCWRAGCSGVRCEDDYASAYILGLLSFFRAFRVGQRCLHDRGGGGDEGGGHEWSGGGAEWGYLDFPTSAVQSYDDPMPGEERESGHLGSGMAWHVRVSGKGQS
jgi:hypothetical protein